MFCNHCGQKLMDDARFCNNCGAQIVMPDPEPAPAPVAEPVAAPVAAPTPIPPVAAPAAPAPQKKKKAPVALFIIIPLVLILAGVGTWLFLSFQEQAELKAAYEEAVELLEAKKYDKALKAFKELEDYEDSEEHVERLEALQEDYDEAMELLTDREYDDALKAFESLGDYRDSEEQEETLLQLQANYDQALHLLEQREYDEALAILMELVDYRDAGERTQELLDLQYDYDLAMTQLEIGMYDVAIELLAELGDFRDSAELVQFGIPYAKAKDAYGWATDLDDFLEAGQMFDQLVGYEDADTMASTCYLKVCQIYLERGDLDAALAASELLNEADGETFQTQLNNSVADAKVFADLEAALQARLRKAEENSATYFDLVQAELDLLASYEDATFIDAALGELISYYILGLQLQEESLQGSDYPYDMVMWFEGGRLRCDVITELHYLYGFLSNNPDLTTQYVDRQDYFQAAVVIEQELEDRIWYSQVYEDESGYYLSYTNNTGYTFSITFLQRFSLEGYFVGPEYTPAGTIEAGATVTIPLEFPADLEYDNWYIDWSFYDIYDGETKLD